MQEAVWSIFYSNNNLTKKVQFGSKSQKMKIAITATRPEPYTDFYWPLSRKS